MKRRASRTATCAAGLDIENQKLLECRVKKRCVKTTRPTSSEALPQHREEYKRPNQLGCLETDGGKHQLARTWIETYYLNLF